MGVNRNDCLWVGIHMDDLCEYITEEQRQAFDTDAYDKKVEGVEGIYDMDNIWYGKILNSDVDPYSEMGSEIKAIELWKVKDSIIEVQRAIEKYFDIELPLYKIHLYHGTLWL